MTRDPALVIDPPTPMELDALPVVFCFVLFLLCSRGRQLHVRSFVASDDAFG